MLRVCLVGEGAQGATYMEALRSVDGLQVVSLVGGIQADVESFAAKWQIPTWGTDLQLALTDEVDAVILGSPSQLHRQQAEQVLAAGKHLLLEIPMALSATDSEELVDLADASGKIAMVAHTRRFAPVWQEMKRRVWAGELTPLHLITQTFFFRRENLNRFGQPRTWVDNMLWHHGCHFLDFICTLLPGQSFEVWAQAGPDHPELGIPMDMTLGMRSSGGVLVSSVCSFNHHGPIQASCKLIGVEDTLIVGGPTLTDYQGEVLLKQEAQDPFVNILAEFVSAIEQGREPESSFRQCLPAMQLIDRLQSCLDNPVAEA